MVEQDSDILARSKKLVENSLTILEDCLSDPEAANVEDGMLYQQKLILLGAKQSVVEAILALAALGIKLDQHRLGGEKSAGAPEGTSNMPEADAQIIENFIGRQERLP